MDSALRRFRKLSAADPSLPERVIHKVAAQVLRPDDAAIDAGAFMGLHTKHLLDTCRDGRVIAYEAHPDFAARLTDQFGRYRHVTVRHTALQDDPEVDTIDFQVDDTHPSRSTLHVDPDAAVATRTVTAPATTLDADLRALGISSSQVGFLKIDVEGAEFAVLKGAQELLTTGKPLVVLEHGADAPRLGRYPVEDLDGYIALAGYEIIAFDGTRLDRLNTDYWYFWLVSTESPGNQRAVLSSVFADVLRSQESDERFDVARRHSTRAVAQAKKSVAHRLPDSLKRRLRRLFPRF